MEKPQLHHVYAALSVLYKSQGKEKAEIEKASSYLDTIQKSVWAWELADTILFDNKSKETNHFAATTLRNKIQREFRELPEASYGSLHDSVLKHLEKFSEGDNILVTQLSLALADLALQMSSWTSVVKDLITRFSPNSKTWSVLLECLTVLPEEVGSRYLKLGAARRDEITGQLQSESATVFAFLEFVYANLASTTNKDHTSVHVYRCWGSWLVLGEFDASTVSNGRIIPDLFEMLVTCAPGSKRHDAASDALCSATYAMADLHVNRDLALQIVPRLAALQAPLVAGINTENSEVVNNITRIITEAGESLLEPLTRTPGKDLGDLGIVSLILTAIKYPDYSVAEVSFPFWFQLAERIYRATDVAILDTYKPVFLELLNVIVKLCELHEDFDETSFDDEDFLEFRDKCTDLMKDIVYIVDVRAVLQLLIQEIEKNNSVPAQWARVESLLFCSKCVMKILNPGDIDIVYRYLTIVFSLPDTANLNLRATGIKLLGECAEWVSPKEDLLNHVLQKLLKDLPEKSLSKHCLHTLDRLSQHGGTGLHSHIEVLLLIVEQAVEVPHSTLSQFIECVAGVTSYQPPLQQAAMLQRIANRPLTALNNNPTSPINDIDHISAIFRGYKGEVAPTDPHPLQPVFIAAWPHLARAMETCAASCNNIERVCRCIRYCLRSVGQRCPDILEPLAAKLIALYNTKPHSCVLYLSSVIVDEFSSDKRLEDGLLGLFSVMGPMTFEILSAPQGLERNPDTVDDFYRLCSRYMQHLGDRVVQSPILPHLVDMATSCLSIKSKDAQCSAVKFIDTVLNKATEGKCATCLSEIKRKGQDMTNSIIAGVSGGLPPSLLTDPTLLLHDILTNLGEEARAWVRTALSTVPTGSYVTPQQVEELYLKLTAADVQGRDVIRSCKEFNQCFT